MKKFSKMLALGLALVMTFSMTAFAEENSPADNNTSAESEALAGKVEVPNTVVVDGKEVTVEVSTKAVAAEAVDYVKAAVKAESGEVVGALDVTLNLTAEEIAKGATVTLKVAGVSDNYEYVVYHQKADGTWEVLDATVLGDGTLSVKLTSLSPLVVVKAGEVDSDDNNDDSADSTDGVVVSPKTGETFPVAGMMLVICLAGAVVCAKKVRFNN